MKRTTTALALTLVLAGVAAACGSDDEPAAEPAETPAPDVDDPDAEPVEDSGEAVCPSNMVIQTDWWPEVEHGGTYKLVGEGGEADPSLFTYSGPIDPAYAVGGIETVEVRAGGDAIEFQPVQTVMKTDPDITFGYINSDDAFQSASTVEVTGVAGTLEINPQMIMWDPTQLQIDVNDPTTIAASGARLLHFPGVTYIDWMIAKGYLDEGQSDPNYGGAPDQWISEGGNYIQQGFATNEVYKYENDIAWKDGAAADVDFALVHNLGWQPYPAVYSVLTERLEELRPCLEVFVPKLQQAWVDFLRNPGPTGDKIIEITTAYNNYWTLSPGLNEEAYSLFESTGIGSNGPDSTYGNFDDARMEALFEEIKVVLDVRGIDLPEGYTAQSVYTNEFIDPSIGL